MIILSQNKKTTLNFNNIQDIRIEQYSTHQKGKYIYKIFGGNFEGYATEMGTYETEERAKEVLKQIMQCYTNTEQYKCFSNNSDKNYETLNYLIENSFVYKMPEE